MMFPKLISESAEGMVKRGELLDNLMSNTWFFWVKEQPAENKRNGKRKEKKNNKVSLRGGNRASLENSMQKKNKKSGKMVSKQVGKKGKRVFNCSG